MARNFSMHGDAAMLIEALAPYRTFVVGVMTRTAAEVSGLVVEYDGRPPSGVIRDAEEPVFLANRGETPQSDRIFRDIIDPCGHEIYQRMGTECCGVLANGDDTTAVWGHIRSHRGIPVHGSTDEDADGIHPSFFAPDSLVLDTRPGRDDDIGWEVAQMVPYSPVCRDDRVREAPARLRGRMVIVLDHQEETP